MPNDNNSALAIVTKTGNGDSKTSIKITLAPVINEREEQLITKLIPAALEALKDQEGDIIILPCHAAEAPSPWFEGVLDD
jgi:hypothetical protein